MNILESWVLNRIIKKAMIQGNQFRGVEELYRLVALEAHAQFTEDNIPTLNSFLQERHTAQLISI